MTLDEAIKHAKEVSSQECTECKKEHEQLANWLEELKQLKNITGDDYEINRLKEVVEADKDGRCIVLPKECPIKIGDRIWYPDKTKRKIESGTVSFPVYRYGHLDDFSVDFDNGLSDDFFGCEIGTLAFLSREEAESKLKKDE